MDKFGQEWVSAAVDGETESHAIADLASDTTSHDKWHNYHMIGDAMRGELPETLNLDICANIADALEHEPTIVAPMISESANDNAQPPSANVLPFIKQFGQYAIAATVAMMTIVGVQNYTPQVDGSDQSEAPVLVTTPLGGGVSPVSLQTQMPQQGYSNEQEQEMRYRVSRYIQDHMLQQRLNAGVEVDNNSDQPTQVNR